VSAWGCFPGDGGRPLRTARMFSRCEELSCSKTCSEWERKRGEKKTI